MSKAEKVSLDVSIVIPTLNEEAAIESCLLSAWQNRPLEVIVVDGGSHDETVAIAEEFASMVIPSRAGRATQQNSGAQAARGDVLLFLHADNRLCPSAITQIERLAQDHPQRPLCGAFRQFIDDPHWVYRWIEWGNACRGKWGLPYGDQGLFLERGLFEQVNGFADIPIMEDVDLMRRVRRVVAPSLLTGPIYVSPRRWKKRGVLRQTLRNWLMVSAWAVGVSPERLARHYQPHVPSQVDSG